MRKALFVFLLLFAANGFAQSGRLTSADVLKAFATLPVGETLAYADDADPDDRLNRPGWYIEKVIFTDKRLTKHAETKAGLLEHFPDKAEPRYWLLNSIEVFKSRAELEAKYWADLQPESPPNPFYYLFTHKNVVLKLDFAFTKQQASEYEAALKSL